MVVMASEKGGEGCCPLRAGRGIFFSGEEIILGSMFLLKRVLSVAESRFVSFDFVFGCYLFLFL